ncbi:MAG: hypothetical protein ACYDDF_03645 [Thermoplasmatota archaeon]
MSNESRARRAARNQKARAPPAGRSPKGLAAVAGVGVVAILVIAGFWYLTNLPPAPGAAPLIAVHVHAGFLFDILGQPLAWSSRVYDLDTGQYGSLAAHLHVQNDPQCPGKIIHFESQYPNGVPNLTVQYIFGQYGLGILRGQVTLDGLAPPTHDHQTYKDNATDRWQVLVSHHTGSPTAGAGASNWKPWQNVTGDYSQFVPIGGDKVLFTYGPTPTNATALQGQEALVANPLSCEGDT